MPLHVVFSFDENDNSPLADLFNVFVKVNVGSDIPRNVYLAFLKAILKIKEKEKQLHIGKTYQKMIRALIRQRSI